MAGNDSIRIGKVIKEFNIGVTTLVTFLRKKGIDVDANPSAKISMDAYELVKKEYSKDQKIKQDSKKVLIKPGDIAKLSSKKDDEAQAVEEVFIRTNISDVPKPKIIGRIDLDAKNNNVRHAGAENHEPAIWPVL